MWLSSEYLCLLYSFYLALKASPSKKRCNSIAALKATSQEIVSSISQEWKDEKRDLLTEGQSFSSLDEEGNRKTLLMLMWGWRVGHTWLCASWSAWQCLSDMPDKYLIPYTIPLTQNMLLKNNLFFKKKTNWLGPGR